MARQRRSADASASPAVRVTVHPPERRRRAAPVILPCACCSCCCCCLHSIGSLAGGIVGSVKALNLPPREVDDPDFPFPFRRDEIEEEGPVLPAGVLYWLLLSLLLGIGLAWGYLSGNIARPQDLLGALLVVFMVLPAPQLGASLLSALAVLLFYEDRRAALARIGKITGYSLLGTFVGVGLLGCFCGLLSIPSVWR